MVLKLALHLTQLHNWSSVLVPLQTGKKRGNGSVVPAAETLTVTKVGKGSKEKSGKTKGIVCNRSDGSNSGRLQSLLRPQSSYRLRNLDLFIYIYIYIYIKSL